MYTLASRHTNMHNLTLGELLASDIPQVRRHAVGILKALDKRTAAVLSQQDKDLKPKMTPHQKYVFMCPVEGCRKQVYWNLEDQIERGTPQCPQHDDDMIMTTHLG